MPSAPLVTLLTRPGCHLCDDARQVVVDVIEDFADVTLEERSIDDDDQLREQYAEEIPVVLIDGRVHTIWRVDAARLRASLVAVSSAPSAQSRE